MHFTNNKLKIRKKRCSDIGTYNSSSSPLFRAFFAMHWNASSTLMPSLADVSKYGIFPFDAHQARAFFSDTCTQELVEFISLALCIQCFTSLGGSDAGYLLKNRKKN